MSKNLEPTVQNQQVAHKKIRFLAALEKLHMGSASSRGQNGREEVCRDCCVYPGSSFPVSYTGPVSSFTCAIWVLLTSQFLALAVSDLFWESGLSCSVWFA